MRTAFYRKKWSSLKTGLSNGNNGLKDLKRLSRQIAYSFLDYYLKDCYYEKDYIDLLCEMTTFSDDLKLTDPGTKALFGIIIERLCDDFEELQTKTYNRVMCQVVSYCRKISAGRELDLYLNKFGIHSPENLLERINKIRENGNFLNRHKSVQKILLLSRVTIGADVAITSVIIQRLSEIFPEAEIVLIGGSKLKEVYGGNSRIKIKEVPYTRKGGLLERLSSWHLVLEIIQQETESCSMENTILVDPDSRLSQLGVLPMVPLGHYFFFDSRSDTSLNRKMSMPELTNLWLNSLTGKESFCYPKVWIPAPYLDAAKNFYKKLQNIGTKKIITINFGVGGNPRKRVGKPLEENILLRLLQEPETVILLDKGFGDKETAYINSLIHSISEKGYQVRHTPFDSIGNEIISHGIVGVESRIGEIASLIANSDEYIGYDSACQHIAAALGTPSLTIFAGSNNTRFIRRWSAFGPKSCNIVHVDTLTDPASIDVDDIITRMTNIRHAM